MLKLKPKALILVNKKFQINKAVAVEIKQFGDKVSFDIAGNNKLFGVGLNYKLFRNKYLEIGTGIYATKTFVELFNKNFAPSLQIGVSGQWRF